MSDAWWAGLAGDRPRLLARLRTLVGKHTGLKFPPERWSSVEQAAERVGRQQGFNDARDWLEWFLAQPPTLAHLDPLIAHLTVGETYFFRDLALFRALQEKLLPELIAQRRASSRCLRFWSAGCSTGEEPYSIVIALQRLLPDWPEWHVSMLASDINPNSLAKARSGRYDTWSFRGGLPQPHDPAFERLGPRSFAVAPQVRELVNFAQLNLADDSAYPRPGFEAFDFIFCRNVLMYLDPPRARAVLERLTAALVEGGWLILSAVESSLVDLPCMTTVRLDDLILFRKQSGAQSVTYAAAPPSRLAASAIARLVAAPAPAASLRLAQVAASTTRGAMHRPAPRDPLPDEMASVPAAGAGNALIARARSSADGGRLEEAARYCEAAIAADKLNPEWTDLHASILLEQGAQAAAETALKRTLYLDPDRVQTHVRLANLLWSQPHRRAEGLRHFRTALELLADCAEQDTVADTGGMTAAQLRTLIQTAIAHDVAGTYGRSA